jgi:hypothetical protein
MISKKISFNLPLPWNGELFQIEHIGALNFLVGPNGSGKSRFAKQLQGQLDRVRILGTDRLGGMEQVDILRNYYGDHFQHGFAKSQFGNFKNAGAQGSGIDTIVVLEERMDLRIQVEATLSHLFNRKITLEWDSGNLVARARAGRTGNSYQVDRDECHGIKELLVLLTNLYNTDYSYLIVDEPELNLHPQYQAFFMQEARKFAGDPTTDKLKKSVFLITHSPFILDFRSLSDLQSVISFDLGHSMPKQMNGLDTKAEARVSSLVPRLNVHHKQLFFSDSPIFVEGILDAQMVGAIQEARGVSIAGAGSCIIDASGCEEVNSYLELCRAFGKCAYFLYDLDSLFGGNLRSCIQNDQSVVSFLAATGVGNDFAKYCGELDAKLTEAIDRVIAETSLIQLEPLVTFLKELGDRKSWDKQSWKKARVAIVTAVSRSRSDLVAVLGLKIVQEIEGRIRLIVTALKVRKINLLPGGTLERYLPSYAGSHYALFEEAKRNAVRDELELLARPLSCAELQSRYGELYEAICELPSKMSVDLDRVLRDYLSDYIHVLQTALATNAALELEQLRVHLNIIQPVARKVFSVKELSRGEGTKFNAIIQIAGMFGLPNRFVRISHQTNAGMGDFKIDSE